MTLPTPFTGSDTRLKALVADDDGDMRLLIATAFRRAGFEVLLGDYEVRADTSKAFVHMAMINLMLRRLHGDF